jgi:hypothetical protein
MECLHAGTPPSDFNGWESKIIYFHKFMDFPVKKDGDDYVKSPPFYCFGHEWVLAILPGGETSTKDGIVSVCLLNTSDEGVTLDWSLTLMKNDGSKSATFQVKGDEDIFDGFRDDGESNCWREYKFKRSILQRTPRGKTSMYLDHTYDFNSMQ